MKLIVDKGELSLPSDFSFEVEKNSAFFSSDGSQTIPATIPATPSDQAKLGYPCRIGRKNRFVNAFPAILRHGVFQKAGTLLVASANSRSITCSLAVEDSDFYALHKETELRELFARKVLTDYSTPADWYAYLFSVYKQETDSDFRVFPVAVNHDAENGYQLNNEPVSASGTGIMPLAHESRLVREGADEINVPEGYGIAPYLKLWKFLELIFTLSGYSVTRNCFQTDSRLSGLVLLHNCSDVICNGRIDYSDLVPDRKISDIIEWLDQKFHSQIVVDAAGKSVDIVLMEDILGGFSDMDLTDRAVGLTNYRYSQSSRVIMEPSTSLEGADPAADTLQSLVQKYGSVLPVNESQFASVSTPCLCLRLATGDYYEVHVAFTNKQTRVPSGIVYRKVRIGSNQFRYDRANSDLSEPFSPQDAVAPMVFAGNHVMAPYVGSRMHRNTSYNGQAETGSQDIIIADYAGLSEGRSGSVISADGRYYYATTQAYNNMGYARTGALSLVPEDMVPAFFGRWNRHLLNNAIEVSGEFQLTIPELMDYDMYKLKLFDGQRVLPVYLRYEVGRRIRCMEARLRVIKDFADGREDAPIEVPAPAFTWQINLSEMNAKKAELQAEHQEGTVIYKFADEDPYISEDRDIYLPAPRAAGEESEHVDREVNFYVQRQVQSQIQEILIGRFTLPMWFDSVAKVS